MKNPSLKEMYEQRQITMDAIRKTCVSVPHYFVLLSSLKDMEHSIHNAMENFKRNHRNGNSR